MRICFALLVALLFAPVAQAQTTVVPGDKLAWDQAASSLATAAGYTYLVKIDTAAPIIVLPAAVTCTGTTPGPYLCTTPFPAATPGVSHNVTVAARLTVAGTPPVDVDSAYSAPLVFTLVVIPGTPVNVRRLPGS